MKAHGGPAMDGKAQARPIHPLTSPRTLHLSTTPSPLIAPCTSSASILPLWPSRALSPLPPARQAQAKKAAENAALRERSSDLVLGLLAIDNRANQVADGNDEDGEEWVESEAHEGCTIFGYLEVSRAPGVLHVSPHSPRHSFDFTNVNVSHHIDHLSFGLELASHERARLPAEVRSHLLSLDGSSHISTRAHETTEHYVAIVPTAVKTPAGETLETYQFTATSHARTKDTLPSLIISYDVSPIEVRIEGKAQATSDFIVQLCAIIGGAFAIFGVVDGTLYSTSKVVRRKMGLGKLA